MNAITVENLSFSYGSNRVLDDIWVEIKFNQIYALLGPSGGGKTTLLRLILGTIPNQNGLIRVMGEEPGLRANCAISFMPQDCALCPYFTVNQTLNYFKNIYRLSHEKYNKRYKTLRSLLNLPSGHLLVNQLSGGTQRRLSIAIALINRPRIAILDEPTVGIDPILRQQIWKYLMTECKQRLTAVIVTHYVEEAVNADRVALMRNGRILAEDNPKALMQTFRTNSLENVFLRLCLSEDKAIENKGNIFYKNKIDSIIVNNFDNDFKENTRHESLLMKIYVNLWILLALLQKNIQKFIHLSVSLLILILPATQALLFCCLYSKELISLNTAIVNEEVVPKHSSALLSSLQSNNRHIIKPLNYSSIAQAINAVQRLDAIAAIRIPKHFSNAIDRRISDGLLADNQTITDSTVGLYMDNSIIMYSNGVIDSLTDSFITFLTELYSQQNKSFNIIAIKVEKTSNSEHILIRDFYMPGNYIFYLYLSQITLSSLLLTQERKDGLFERSLIAGISHELVFLSHLITSCLLSVLQILFLYITGFLLFNNINNGSIELVFSYLMLQSLSAISLGLLISALVERDITCILLSCFITLPQLFCSGLIWPLESLPLTYKFIFQYFSPLSIPVQTMRNIVLRGWDLNNTDIRYGFLYSFIPTLICLTIALIIFKKK